MFEDVREINIYFFMLISFERKKAHVWGEEGKNVCFC
jgi:hypothetical protein